MSDMGKTSRLHFSDLPLRTHSLEGPLEGEEKQLEPYLSYNDFTWKWQVVATHSLSDRSSHWGAGRTLAG